MARWRTLFDNGGIHQADRLTFTDCRLYGVNLTVGTYRLLGDYRLMSLALTNCLTERCYIVASEESEDPELPSLVVHLRNNLFRNGTLGLADYLETGAWSVRDNLFDTVALTGLGVANSHNGYISTTVLAGSEGGDKTIAPPADYQEGPLGPYYYPTSGTKLAQLIDAGSRSAADAGLACATTRVDHQPDEDRVDIGFHYRLSRPFWTDYGGTAQELAQWIVGPGFTVQNATYTGAGIAKGTFGNGWSAGFPIDRGVILSSGDIALANGPNSMSSAWEGQEDGQHGDEDLDALVQGLSTEDAAVLEFDVLSPLSTTLVFASEEYPEWIGQYNDIMAIFVDGVNIAVVPGTALPVSVNTVNGGCAWPNQTPATNPQYYVDNRDPRYSSRPPYAAPCPVYDLQYDGMTVLLTALASISANTSHHVKIAIADATDEGYDSAVFIKAHVPCR